MTKILLVEDNEMNRDMLSRRLQKNGYEVVLAIDGEEGMAKAHSELPALILMDMSLPGIGRLGSDAAPEGRTSITEDPCHRADRACDDGRP